MKAIWMVWGLLVLTGSAFGGFKIPKGVFTSENFDEAEAKATEKNLPIVYVYTDAGSS